MSVMSKPCGDGGIPHAQLACAYFTQVERAPPSPCLFIGLPMREDHGCCPCVQAALHDHVALGSIPLQRANYIWYGMILLREIQHLHGLQKHVCGDYRKYSRLLAVNHSFPPGKPRWPSTQILCMC